MDPRETLPADEDTEAVRSFFNHWRVYRTVVDENYLGHRDVYAALAAYLKPRAAAAPLRVLDLACGDAGETSKLLRPLPVARYEGVDLSPVALDLARKTLADAPFAVHLTEADYAAFIRTCPPASLDLVWIGLSFHHLSQTQKATFFRDCLNVLAPTGCFAFHEPLPFEGESRETFIERWWQFCRAQWTKFTDDERQGFYRHVSTADWPEHLSTLNVMAKEAGFRPARVLHRDRQSLYGLLAFEPETAS